MARSIPERDWKVLRDVEEAAIERFGERGLEEVRAILADAEADSSDRLFRILDAARSRAKTFDRTFGTVSRSTAFLKFLSLRSENLIEPEEFARFSEETRAAVERSEAALSHARFGDGPDSDPESASRAP